MKQLYLLTAAIVAAVTVLVAISSPPPRFALAATGTDGTIPGVIHVHTRRSDGRGTPDEIASAAAREGLKFVILTDHGDATRKPDPPAYRSGVLCVDAVEISSTGGHYLALGMPAAPYPLGGDARDVVEDVRRLGGWGVVAHPNSPKVGLSWRAWETPFDAIEWVNPDTSWRVRVGQTGWRARWRVIEALAGYPFRSAETMARLIGGTTLGEERWDELVRTRRLVILAGADAHARLGFGTSDPGDSGVSLPIPGYRASFRTLSVHVRPEGALTGDPVRDADAVLEGLRRGHAYVAINGLASPPIFQFTATNGREVASAGDELAAGAATLQARSNAPPSFTTILRAGGRVLASVQGETNLTHLIDTAGVYRVEIVAPSPDGPIPWVVSNPIYVGVQYPAASSPIAPAASATHALTTTSGWWTEHDPTSVVALDQTTATTGPGLRLRYGLSSGAISGQYVALAVHAPMGEPYRRLRFSARGERPGRLEVQLRSTSPPGERWQRSVYIDQSDRIYTIDFSDMTPVAAARATLPLADVRDILFVIDTTHTAPGSSGRLWITDPILQR